MTAHTVSPASVEEQELGFFKFMRSAIRLMKFLLLILCIHVVAVSYRACAEEKSINADVSAERRPVQIVFRLYKTKIKPEETLWYQLELENTGDKKFLVIDPIFRSPGDAQFRSSTRAAPIGIYFEVYDPKGRLYYFRKREADLPACLSKEVREYYEADGRRIQEILREGERRGWSFDETQNKILHRDAASVEPRNNPPLWLEPGMSTKTWAWVHKGICDDYFKIPQRKPIDNFSELWDNWYVEPGKYRIRAVYDHKGPPESTWLKKFEKQNHIAPSKRRGEDVVVRTPFIEFEVEP